MILQDRKGMERKRKKNPKKKKRKEKGKRGLHSGIERTERIPDESTTSLKHDHGELSYRGARGKGKII